MTNFSEDQLLILGSRGISPAHAESAGVVPIADETQLGPAFDAAGVDDTLPVPWPSDPRYLVSRTGDITGPRGRILKPRIQNGRAWISWCRSGHSDKTTMQVSVIVCETFHGPRPVGMQAAHHDGDALNNAASNVLWKTPKENAADKYRHGTVNYGAAAVHRAKLTEREVREIREKRSNGESLKSLAVEYGVSHQTISSIALGTTWSFLP